MTLTRAVFLDRDGIINELCVDPESGKLESPLTLEDVKLIEGVSHGILRLREAGYLIAGVTNQPSAAKGRITLALQEEIHQRILELLSQSGVIFDAWRICLHHPDGALKELTGDCPCRKPKPGMILDIAAQLGIDLPSSWMIGDSDSDVEAGISAGTRTVLIEAGDTHKRSNVAFSTLVCPDLKAAVRLIENDRVLRIIN